MKIVKLFKQLLVGLVLSVWVGSVWAAPKVEHWITPEGLKVYFIALPNPNLPILDIELGFNAGSAYDGKALGVSALTSKMLLTGNEALSGRSIRELFDSVGAEIESDSDIDTANYSLRTLTLIDQKNKALDTFIKALTPPSFPQNEFEGVKNQLLAENDLASQDATATGYRTLTKALYGTHPYNMFLPSKADIEARTVADVKAFYESYYVLSNAKLNMVGNINRAEAEQIATRIAAVLRKGQAAVPIPEVTETHKEQTIKIPFAASQTFVLLGQLGAKMSSSDRVTLDLANYALGGGGFSSRLTKEIRSKRGMTYGVKSKLENKVQRGYFAIELSTKASQAQEANKLIKDVVANFYKEGITAEELAVAKKNLLTSLAYDLAQNKSLLKVVSLISTYNLPLDYLDTYSKEVQAATIEQVNEAFRKHINPDKFITILVGSENGTDEKDDESTEESDVEESVPEKGSNSSQ